SFTDAPGTTPRDRVAVPGSRDETLNGPRHRDGVVRPDQHATFTVLHHLRNAADLRRNDRYGARHSLQNRDGEVLRPRWKHQDIHVSDAVADARHEPMKPRRESEGPRLRLERRPLWPIPIDVEPKGRTQSGTRGQQRVYALPGIEARGGPDSCRLVE